MVNRVQFVHKELLIPVVVIGIFLLILFLWKERKVASGRLFVVNGIVGFVAIVSLALIALKPFIYTKPQFLEIVVLTDNYKQKTLDSLQKNNKNLLVKNYQKGKIIIDKNITPNQVFVLGNGIEKYDLWQLKNISTKYIKGNPIEGIIKLKYKSKLSEGENLSVEGLYHLPKKGNKLFLEFPKGTKLDSITFNNTENQEFQLNSRVKVTDRLLYSLVERDSLNRIVESNPLPVEVKKKENLRVLIINSFPTFDTKYLKNFLAESGHEVVVRNKLTKGKFKFEYFNAKREQVSITTNYLKGFDVLIIDESTYFNLSVRQRNVIYTVVEKDGIGVFIQPDVSFFTRKNSKKLFNFLRDKSSSFKMKGIKKRIAKYSYTFKNGFQLEAIHKNENKIYSGYLYYGKGKIATTVAQQTFQLILSGNEPLFKQFWTEILNEVSKTKFKTGEFKSKIPLANKNEPFPFELQTNIDKPNVISVNGKIPLIQDVNQSERWFGEIYPKVKGWNQIYIENDSLSTYSFYVINQDEFKSLKNYDTSIENSRYFNDNQQKIMKYTSKKMINVIWLFIIFLLSIVYLWLYPKFNF